MTILTVLQYPDERLRQVAKPVEAFGAATQKIIDDMFETLYATESCGGYAAVQMNIPLRIVVIDYSEKKNEPLCLVNPEILEKSGELFETEGCLSVPGDTFARVKRAKYVKCKAQDRHGKSIIIENDGGYLSRCIQHEIDHLNGTLFIDYLSPLKRRRLDKRLEKMAKEGVSRA